MKKVHLIRISHNLIKVLHKQRFDKKIFQLGINKMPIYISTNYYIQYLNLFMITSNHF